MNRAVRSLLVLALGVVPFLGIAQGITADEILAKVEEQSFFGTGQGNLYAAFAVTVEEKGQAPASYAFRVWAKEYPGVTKTLLLYVAPELVAGTLYLAHIPEEGPGRMWLWFPALMVLKEIVGESEREGEFIAGSGITYDDMAAGFIYREGYRAEIQGEETVDGQAVWRLELVASDPTAEWSRIRLWVHKDAYIVLRAEFYDRRGVLARVLTVPELVEDAIGLRPGRLVVESPLEGSRATVVVKTRSTADIPDEYFQPEKLPTLEL